LPIQGKVLVKVGTSSITNSGGLDTRVLNQLADNIAWSWNQGNKFVIITSGARVLGEMRGVRDSRTAAGVGQPILMEAYRKAFDAYGIQVEQLLLESTHFDRGVLELLNRSKVKNIIHAISTAWSEGVIPVINENDPVATEKTTLGDNDKLARRISLAMDVNITIFLSTVDSRNGRGGADSKAIEIRRILRAGGCVMLVDGKQRDVVKKVLEGDVAGIRSAEELIGLQRNRNEIKSRIRNTLF
jgi:glutamate 5-kinase